MAQLKIPNTRKGRQFLSDLRHFNHGFSIKVRGRGPRQRLTDGRYKSHVPLSKATWVAVYLKRRKHGR